MFLSLRKRKTFDSDQITDSISVLKIIKRDQSFEGIQVVTYCREMDFVYSSRSW